jgi:hypothetical protein
VRPHGSLLLDVLAELESTTGHFTINQFATGVACRRGVGPQSISRSQLDQCLNASVEEKRVEKKAAALVCGEPRRKTPTKVSNSTAAKPREVELFARLPTTQTTVQKFIMSLVRP